MTLQRRYVRLLPSLLAFVAFSGIGFAQSVPTQIDPGNLTGIMPYNTYGGTRENVSLATGDLNLQIPLASLPGRNGLDFTLGLVYDSKTWSIHSFIDPTGHTLYLWKVDSPNGMRLNLPTLSVTWVKDRTLPTGTVYCAENPIVSLGDGSKHSFYNVHAGCTLFLNAGGSQPYGPSNLNTQQDSRDGAFLTLNTGTISDVVLLTKTGGRLHFVLPPFGSSLAYFSRQEDSDGNVITCAVNGSLTTVKDTLNRTITITTNASTQTVSYVDSNGLPQTITLALATPPGPQVTFTLPSNSGPSGSYPPIWVSAATLATGRGYVFSYDNYGELTKVVYPTGGYTRYDYGLFAAYNASLAVAVDFREIIAKHVCKDVAGACTPSTEDSTTYSPTAGATVSNNTVEDVIDPLGNKTHYQFSTCNTCSPTFFSPRELLRTVYQGTSGPLRTIQTDYNSTVGDALPIRVTTTLTDITPNLVTKHETDYDTYTATGGVSIPIDNAIASREYDYGSGSAPTTPLRQTTRTFLHTNSVNGIDYTTNSIHILDRKLTENVEDGSGTPFSKTQYEYDNYGVISSSGAVQRDAAFGTSYKTRGNVTKSQVWRNTDGVWLATTKTYDDAGNAVSMTVPSNAPYDTYNRTTSFSYADAWANGTCTPSGGNGAAYITAVTNALTQTAHYTYNSCTGTMASATDPNSQLTTFTYDLAARLSQTTFPDAGQISDCFSDLSGGSCYSTGQIYMTRTDAIAPGSSKIWKAYVDGIGNAVQAQLASDPEGTDYTDLTYDALERKATASNPHRATGASTDGTTQYSYDPFSRVTLITQPDGSNVNTSYLGNQTTVTDEAGKKRTSLTDGLGRLTTVWEDPVGVNYETDYQYDVLNNLIRVDQKGSAPTDSTKWRTRTFTYNSLSQLLTANNPEIAAATNYSYDNNRNVVSKNAPAPNQTNPSVQQIIAFCYDALNRLTSKWYATPPSGCPQTSSVANYFYDQTSYNGLTIANGIGRRTGMSDTSGATSWSYDPMGRVTTESLTINAKTKTVVASYNPDGSIKTITYPIGSGSVISYSYNTAGRVTQVADTVHNITYLQSTSYAPPGELALGTYGSVIQTSIFSNRLQPCWYYATTGTALSASTLCNGTATAATTLDLKYNFGWGTNDNGTLQAVTNNKDSNRSVNYAYDSLNRITSATTPNADCTVLSSGITKNWGETFTIDAWGNLTNRTTTKCSAESLSVVALPNNQLSGFGYDAAGNMTSNGSATYTYDAENRLQVTGGVTYTYDGDGNRVIKSNGTEYWGEGPLLESSSSGVFTFEYIFAAGRRIARRNTSSGAFSYFFSDDLGSTDKLTNAAGTIQNDSEYYPYGGERVYTQGATNQHYRFTGKERDTETGLDNFGARFDASSLGRFMTPDWAARPTTVPYAVFGDPQSLNLYTYVRNDPVSRADADGHTSIDSSCYANGNGCDFKGGNASTEQTTSGGAATTAGSQTAQQPAQNQCGFWCRLFHTKAYDQMTEEHRQWLINNAKSEAGKERIKRASAEDINNAYDCMQSAGCYARVMAAVTAASANPTSPNQMNQQVERGQAPKSVDRVDTPRFPNEKPHIEFKDGNALNNDGTWKHGERVLTNAEEEWITGNGWKLPQ